MKVVIAPDSFKDALRATQVARHIADGVTRIMPQARIDQCPVSDGGEGFTDIFRFYPLAKLKRAQATDPMGRPIEAGWVFVPNKPAMACYELASTSGLELLSPDERDPLLTTTYGCGTLIRDGGGATGGSIVLGIGGSATNDAGCGIAQALGVRFFDHKDALIEQPITGASLTTIARLERTVESDSFGMSMKIACDVTNPLTGPNGAAHVYGPQKGATPEQLEQLDTGLRHMAQLWRDQLGVDVEHLPGAGAAGGVGGGLVAMLGAELVPGAELVLDTIGFDDRIKGAGLVITGEGRLDGQSLQGKAAMAVARRCQRAGVPCVALVGGLGNGAERALEHGLTRYIVIGEGLDPAESIARTGELLEQAAAQLAREQLH